MKFPYPTLSRMMSGRSAITEPGDGELTVPPILIPVTEIFSPLSNLFTPDNPIADTFLYSASLPSIDAQISKSFPFNPFKAGRWDVHIFHTFVFTGTQNVGSMGRLTLTDPLSSVNAPLSFFNYVANPVTKVSVQDFSFLFLNDNWFLSLQNDATIIADVAINNVTVYARRVF